MALLHGLVFLPAALGLFNIKTDARKSDEEKQEPTEIEITKQQTKIESPE